MFRSGVLNRVSWNAGGTGAFLVLDNFRHRWTERDSGFECTSAGHLGLQAFVSSILRGDGEFSAHIRDDQHPSDIGLKAQATGILKLEFGNRRPITIPIFITEVPYENETAGGTDFSVRCALNQELVNTVGSSAAYSYPS